jgi:hypothetical protein
MHESIDLEIVPETLAGGAERTVDVYSVATYSRVADTTDVATLFHYAGSWTFGADPSGTTVLRSIGLPTEHPVPDNVVLVPR